MGEIATLAKARQELEDLYLGVPDDSVNLTFEDLAKIKQQHGIGETKKPNMFPINEMGSKGGGGFGSSMEKSPSLDFTKGLHACKPNRYNHHHHGHVEDERAHVSRGRYNHHYTEEDHVYRGPQHHQVDQGRMHAARGPNHHHHVEEDCHHQNNPRRNMGMVNELEMSVAYDDTSVMTTRSGYQDTRSGYQDRGERRRPGVPHSNICTICSTYIYIFRHRCLVCGRVYCRHCVTVGMGEMTEGRKCVECLGRRFSQRYIHRAGRVGCCCSRYPSVVKQQELKWAEKGPRGTAPRESGRNGMGPRSRSPIGHNDMSRTKGGPVSRSKSPVTPRTPRDSHDIPSFVMSAQYSPYSHHVRPPSPF